MANSVRVAAIQMTSINDLTSNFATCSLLVKQEATVEAKLLCFPENFAYVGAKQGNSLNIAEPLDGQTMKSYCNLARESNIWLSLGGFQEKGSDDTHLRNTHVVIDDGGNIRSTYSKMHLQNHILITSSGKAHLKKATKDLDIRAWRCFVGERSGYGGKEAGEVSASS